MAELTIIYNKCFKVDKNKNKTYLDPELSPQELIFLYEIDAKIEGFGLERDPRIKELRDQRKQAGQQENDMLIIFGCENANQIAHNQEEVRPNTKAYLGPLFPGIFQLGLEHIGISFPEEMVGEMKCTNGGKNKDQLIQELIAKNINILKNIPIREYAEDMINSKDFTISETREDISLVRLTVKDIGFPDGATTDQIYQRAKDLGLELCPAETGPNLRLQNSTLEYTLIAMKQIADRLGNPRVFYLGRDGRGLRLDGAWAEPDREWASDSKFVFRLRPSAGSGQASLET